MSDTPLPLDEAANLRARVAELEAQRDRIWNALCENAAHANALREALEKVRGCTGCVSCERTVAAALAAHPAASLAAYRKSVLEEAATECVVAVHAPDDIQHDPLRLETFDDAVGACAALIRALAAQAQEVKP